MKYSKLALGTVQFGLDYGVNNRRGRIPESESASILSAAFAAGIDTLDTAGAYGDSEKVIGNYIKKTGQKFKVITKFAGAETRDINKAARQSLADIRVSGFYGCLLHHFEDYRKNPRIWDDLQLLRDQGLAGKIGFSLYQEEELDHLLGKNLKIDLLQVPYSIFDRRFEKNFRPLHEAGVEVHIRSVFLQGLVFKEPDGLNSYFDKIKAKIRRLQQIAAVNNLTIAGLCLNFAWSNKWVDKVIVGVDNLQNLKELIGAQKYRSAVKNIEAQLSDLREDDKNILLPFNWKTS